MCLSEAKSPPHSRRPHLVVVALLWAVVTVPYLSAQASKPTDYQVKAAYLYNFGRFIEWPAGVASAKGDSFTVCVFGEDPFGPTLDATLAGQTIAGKPVMAKRISTVAESVGCEILFLSSADKGQFKKIVEAATQQGVLTVSDMPQFSQRGGMIEFILEGKRVRFEVNLAATEHAGLALSSELLRVASKVRRTASPGD